MHPLSKRMQNQLCMGTSALVKEAWQAGGATTEEDEEDPLRWECGERVPGKRNKRQEVGEDQGVCKSTGGDLFHGSPRQDQEEIKLPR